MHDLLHQLPAPQCIHGFMQNDSWVDAKVSHHSTSAKSLLPAVNSNAGGRPSIHLLQGAPKVHLVSRQSEQRQWLPFLLRLPKVCQGPLLAGRPQGSHDACCAEQPQPAPEQMQVPSYDVTVTPKVTVCGIPAVKCLLLLLKRVNSSAVDAARTAVIAVTCRQCPNPPGCKSHSPARNCNPDHNQSYGPRTVLCPSTRHQHKCMTSQHTSPLVKTPVGHHP